METLEVFWVLLSRVELDPTSILGKLNWKEKFGCGLKLLISYHYV